MQPNHPAITDFQVALKPLARAREWRRHPDVSFEDRPVHIAPVSVTFGQITLSTKSAPRGPEVRSVPESDPLVAKKPAPGKCGPVFDRCASTSLPSRQSPRGMGVMSGQPGPLSVVSSRRDRLNVRACVGSQSDNTGAWAMQDCPLPAKHMLGYCGHDSARYREAFEGMAVEPRIPAFRDRWGATSCNETRYRERHRIKGSFAGLWDRRRTSTGVWNPAINPPAFTGIDVWPGRIPGAFDSPVDFRAGPMLNAADWTRAHDFAMTLVSLEPVRFRTGDIWPSSITDGA